MRAVASMAKDVNGESLRSRVGCTESVHLWQDFRRFGCEILSRRTLGTFLGIEENVVSFAQGSRIHGRAIRA